MLIREAIVTLVRFIEDPEWCVGTELVKMCGCGCKFRRVYGSCTKKTILGSVWCQ